MDWWYPPAITTGVPATKQPPPPPTGVTHVPPVQTWPVGQSLLMQHWAQVPLQHFWLDTQQVCTPVVLLVQTLAFAQHVPPT
jgi:hypothetical protein